MLKLTLARIYSINIVQNNIYTKTKRRTCGASVNTVTIAILNVSCIWPNVSCVWQNTALTHTN